MVTDWEAGFMDLMTEKGCPKKDAALMAAFLETKKNMRKLVEFLIEAKEETVSLQEVWNEEWRILKEQKEPEK